MKAGVIEPAHPAILVHGGAGSAPREPGPRQRACWEAAQGAWRMLAAGGSALDAVEAAVAVLENDPQFNAGYGSVLNAHGEVEMDAALMAGDSLAAGAVGAVQGVVNPISLARAVLEEGRHVLLSGEGARRFAEEAGVALCSPQALVVPEAADRDARDTVGAVAIDTAGRLAAATSTGGTRDKRAGRIGDSPLIGSGTYADAGLAVSCTGDGEAIIRTVLGRSLAERVQPNEPLEASARAALERLVVHTRGQAGLIVTDKDGRMAYAHNAPAMPVAWVSGGQAKGTDL